MPTPPGPDQGEEARAGASTCARAVSSSAARPMSAVAWGGSAPGSTVGGAAPIAAAGPPASSRPPPVPRSWRPATPRAAPAGTAPAPFRGWPPARTARPRADAVRGRSQPTRAVGARATGRPDAATRGDRRRRPIGRLTGPGSEHLVIGQEDVDPPPDAGPAPLAEELRSWHSARPHHSPRSPPYDRSRARHTARPGAGRGAGARAPPPPATLLFAGVLLSLLAGVLHPDRQSANSHARRLRRLCGQRAWTAVHLGQFVGMAAMIAGLLALSSPSTSRAGAPGWAAPLSAAARRSWRSALYGVLQAVDGVALKQAVDAWAGAPEAEKAARLAERGGNPVAGVGGPELPELHAGARVVLLAAAIVATARSRGRSGLPDGAVRPGLHRAGLGARGRGLLGHQHLPTLPASSWSSRGASGCSSPPGACGRPAGPYPAERVASTTRRGT